MTAPLFIKLLFLLAGLVSLLAAVLNWQWFFETNGTQFVVRYLGKLGARIFYGAMGVVMILLAYFF